MYSTYLHSDTLLVTLQKIVYKAWAYTLWMHFTLQYKVVQISSTLTNCSKNATFKFHTCIMIKVIIEFMHVVLKCFGW